jgi:2-methylcitrate dehydratase PrpD
MTGGGRDYLTRLAGLAAGIRFEGLGSGTVAAARAVTLDTLGAILAGSRLAENARLADLAAERSASRAATLVGHGRKAEPMFAALANGTAGVALEMDEGNRWGGGHPSIHVLPATLAVAEELAVDGRRFIEALVAGYEVTSRLGGASQVRPNVHSHGTWGTAGAAVAVAKLRDHDTAVLRTVINLATSMSPANSWAPCFEGATIRNLYPGRSNLQGILATHLLACGYTAVHDAPSDLYGTILGERFDREAVVEGVSAEDRVSVYRIERNYFKFHACCLYNHPVLDAVHALVQDDGLAAHDIRRIRVTSLPFVTRMADPSPANMLAAKFSVPYAVAAAVIKGTTDVSAFRDAVREDATVRQLAARVEVAGDDTMSLRGGPDQATARISVELGDGRILTRQASIVHGDAANPRSRPELEAKFRALASEALGETRANDVVAMVARLDQLQDIRELTALLRTA